MYRSRAFLASLFASILILPFASARAGDNETPVKAADVPKAVVDAVAKKYPGCVVTAWAREEEDKKVAYEAKVEITTKDKDGKASVRRVEALLAEDGKVVSEEEVVGADALPAAVKKAIEASAYAKATVGRIERTTLAEKADEARYEIVFELDGKKHEVTFDAAGKLIEDEAAEEGDDHGGKGKEDKGVKDTK